MINLLIINLFKHLQKTFFFKRLNYVILSVDFVWSESLKMTYSLEQGNATEKMLLLNTLLMLSLGY